MLTANLGEQLSKRNMRDESSRVGRPRKGTQRKPKERTDRSREPAPENFYTLSNDDDYHIPSGSGEIKQPISPINILNPQTALSSVLSLDPVSELNQFEENENEMGSQEALCAFCNCGSDMAQILGQINRYYPSPDFDPVKYEEKAEAGEPSAEKYNDISKDSLDIAKQSDFLLMPDTRSVGRPPGKRKRRGRQQGARHHMLSVDMCTFGTPCRPDISDVFDADGCIWAHHCCAAWSAGVCQTDSYDLENVDKAAYKAIGEQCSHCKRHGASTECQVQACTKLYHYPCCASAGAFQDIKSMTLLCPDHLDLAIELAGSEACCVLCSKTGDISKQLFCTSCGRHYHGQCLDPPVSVSAIVRMGWQCPECKVCQGCRQPGDDEKMLFCDECDKGFHTYCLSPPMSSVPKTAWKCYSCRKCEDCGSNVPGSGPSCRWHFNYTVCDRCYQQRKKGTMPCCPMCGKAVRSSCGEFSRQCMKCGTLVHCRCDKNASNEGVNYVCPNCKHDNSDEDSEMPSFMDPKEESNDSLMLSPIHSSTADLDAQALGQRTVTIAEAEAISRTATCYVQREPSPLLKQNEMEDLDLKGIDINFDEVMMETDLHGQLMQELDDFKPDNSDSLNSPPHMSILTPYPNQLPSQGEKQLSHLPSIPGKAGRGKKKMLSLKCRGRPTANTGRGKKSKANRGGRPRSKTASTSGSNKENIQSGVINTVELSRKDDSDDPEGLHSTVIMVSTKDRFTLEQDICMCCGSFGKGSEGHLIACAQCGQCFHPYCVNVKVNKVVMTKGWRCLDCTVCEGCGKNEDEGKLLLCDGCDISYHIYCLDPPLVEVPSDGWKCQWCVECVTCGTTNPGVSGKWMSGYTQCGPCASDVACPVCNKTYLDHELVVKCMHCLRWLHADCDGLTSEDDIELAASYKYHCTLCREQTGHYGIFSTSWSNIERGVYADGKLTGFQSVIVTQTTTTIMASGVANRRSKSISNPRSNRNPLSASGWNQRQPQELLKTSAEGTFDVQLPSMRAKSRKEDHSESDNVALTDDGLRQIRSLVVKSSSRGQSRNKDKQSKRTSIDDFANERETKTSGQLTETAACSENIGENRQPICLPGDSKDLGMYSGNVNAGSYQKIDKERKSSGPPAVDKRTDLFQNRKPIDKRDDAVDFFGSALLKISNRKLKNELQNMNDTQSSEEEPSKANRISGRKQGSRGHADLGTDKPQQSKKMMLPGGAQAGSYQSRMKVGQFEEEIQHQESLYNTLNMLVSGTEDAESRLMRRERELSEQKHQQNISPPNITTSMRQHPKSNISSQTNSIAHSNEMAQTGDLDLMGLTDLPHVDGHEVEEIFAGIEREMSVEGTPQSHAQSPMDSNASEYPKTVTGEFTKDQTRPVNSPGAFQSQGRLGVGPVPRPEAILAPGYTEHQHPQHFAIPRQEFPSYDVYRNNQSFPLEQNVNYKAGRKPVQPQSGETDAFKVVFGEEPEVKSKAREGATSPKIDGQKQLKKWEQDEKLDSLATISPVLYANIVHPELKIDYPEWPNRARAIARLWRKLPQAQREPFRLRARDNRVKQKDQGRKLGPFQKTATPTSVDGASHLYDSSSNLSSEKPGSLGLTTYREAPNNSTLSQMSQGPNNSMSYSETASAQSRISVGVESQYEDQSLEKRLKESDNMLRSTSGNLSVPNILSPSSQFSVQQNSAAPFQRTASRGSSNPSLPDIAGHDIEFSGLAATPTTPVFASSPFQTSSLSVSSISSPGQISPSFSMTATVGEKRKMKKTKSSKEQTELEKEEKKRRVAVEQEKERQWKLLQQQRLREQQLQQQTPAVQQMMIVKEQMQKEKSSRKSELLFASDQAHTVNEIRSNLLPHVEPLALTQSTASKDTLIVSQILESIPVNHSSKQRVVDPSTTTTTSSSHAGLADFQKSSLQSSPQIVTSQVDFPNSTLSSQDPANTQFGFNSGRSQQNTELDNLLKINDSDLIKMENSRILANDVGSISSGITVKNMPTVYVSKALTQLQTSAGGENDTAVTKDGLPYVTESNSTNQVIQQQALASAFAGQTLPGNGHPIVFASEGSSVEKAIASSDSQAAKALSGFLLDSHSSLVQSGPNDNFDKQANSGVGQQQQQQALLFQQQQFMAAQQQYIQWQLQQRNPELFQSMTTPIQFPSYPDKDLPEVDSEEQHQERIRFLYRQRQMQKQQVVQIQQQLHQQQVYTSPQLVTGSSNRPQMDQTQHYFVQQLMQYQQQIPEALQQQFLIEYSRQMQQRGDVSQNALQYEKFLAELAQRFGFPVQQANAQAMPVVQHGVSWPTSSSNSLHPTLQQILAYNGITEEKAKELTPQQLYQLQMQYALMMQMAASGLYPTQAATIRHQSPAGLASRKNSGSAAQSKKSRDARKPASQDKAAKAEGVIKSPVPEDKTAVKNDDFQLIVQGGSDRNAGPADSRHDTATVQQNIEKLVSPAVNATENVKSSSSLSSVDQMPNRPASSLSGSSSNSTVKETDTLQSTKLESQMKTSTPENTPSSILGSKTLPGNVSLRNDYFTVGSSAGVPSTAESKPVYTDGVHRGTSLGSEDMPVTAKGISPIPNVGVDSSNFKMKSSMCSDGVNCSNDADNIGTALKGREKDVKVPCTDGIHCGTDSEGEEIPEGVRKKQPCSDGIHCGTDSEDESRKPKSQNVCADGIHCGTDSEDEENTALSNKNSSAKGSIKGRNSTDPRAKVCEDGIHCGTDSEEEKEDDAKLDAFDGQRSVNRISSAAKPTTLQRPLVVVCRHTTMISTSQPYIMQARNSPLTSTNPSELPAGGDSNHTLEVIQEGDVTQTTFNAMESINRNIGVSQQTSKSVSASSPSTPLLRPQLHNPNQELSDHRITPRGAASEPMLGHPPSTRDITGYNPVAASSQNIPLSNELAPPHLPMQTVTSKTQSPKAPTPVPHIKTPNIPPGIIVPESESKVQLPSQSQGQLFSPKATTQGSGSQQVESQNSQKQKPKVVGIPPTSPQYQQLFMHQHQLLIMQFQQYQYQLQAQYQQLSQQQMSPQQQYLLQQQYHQQLMLLQRQFVQQQAQLQTMASNGMQFTEQELNIMYQQQMVAQQTYKQWVATLSLDQQGQLHARMQANMQQVQQGMTAMMQNALKNSTENSREKPKKQRNRRSRKPKSEVNDPAATEIRTPTQPQTPSSITDSGQPLTPNKDVEFDARRKAPSSGLVPLAPSGPMVQQAAYATQQTAALTQTPIAPNHSAQTALDAARSTGIQSHIPPYASVAPEDQSKSLAYADDKKTQPPHSFSILAGKEQKSLTSTRHEWPSTQSQLLPQQPTAVSQLQSQANLQTSQSQVPRIDIVPESSNPFSDVYHEMEKKARTPGNVPNTPAEQSIRLPLPNQSQQPDPWKTMSDRSEQMGPRPAQQQILSTSALYYPNTSTSTPLHNKGLGSPTVSQSHSISFSLQNSHYSGQTTLATLSSTTVVNHSSEMPVSNSAETHLAPSSLQQYQWTTSVIGHNATVLSDTLSEQHVYGIENQKTTSIMYPPQNGPTGNTSVQSAFPPQFQDRLATTKESQARNTALGSQPQVPPTYDSKPQPVSTMEKESINASFAVNGDQPVKDNVRATQKRQKNSSVPHMPSGNVDFSLLSPEEQQTFILERKREDFERRRRLLEEQRQLRDQENQKGLVRKNDRKVSKAKQPRRLKGVKEKDPIEKPNMQALLVLEDKNMKLPLCEPEVHLLYPLVQPFGSGYLNGDKLLLGAFGNAGIQGEMDYYSQFPSPNPPVTSSNPPTPPSSLPPSPGTINQSLRDSLQMIPTEGIFDDMPQKPDVRRGPNLFEQNIDKGESAQKDSKDNVLVTLVMTGNSRSVPNDRVSHVTDMLGIAKPETIQVVDESSEKLTNGNAVQRPQATSVGRERDVHFSCLDNKAPRSGDDSKGPFCKHCDISIHGTGYVECKGDNVHSPSSGIIKIGNNCFEKVAITPGIQLANAFCSELCLNSYYSLPKSKRTSDFLNQQESLADDSGQFIDPVRSVIPVSTGEPSNSDCFGSNVDGYGMRGDVQASSPSLGLVKRKIPEDGELDKKRPRPGIWKRWKIVFTSKRAKKDTARLTVTELLDKYGCTLKPKQDTIDTRECMLCGGLGDGLSEGTARLINYDVNVWVHLNCALWSLEVYETLNGALHNVQKAYERGIQTTCVYCQKKGATVTCARVIGSQMRRCEMNYHFSCAIKANCVFFKDKTVLCPQHKSYGSVDQRLPSYAVFRKVYVNRDITKQLARVLRLNNEKEQRVFTIRIGSLTFHELGQLLPHQLQKFHSKDAIYPVGFRTTRFFWSREKIGQRCSYLCSVEERNGNPHFVVSVNDNDRVLEEITGSTPKEVWSCIFEPVRKLREEAKLVKIFPEFVTGEDLYGLSDPSIQRIIESLPGVDTIHDYSFRFGRTPIIMAELPLAVNPTGCIRSESTRNVHLNRPVSLRTASSTPSERVERGDSVFDDSSQGSLLRSSWAVSKTAQYRRMKSEWKNYVLLCKSRIQGLGLFAVRDIEPNTMIIEYIGSLIRNEVANKRERIYENSNRGVYMFRVDSDTVIDATMTGGPARYINHSCDPNCVAEVVIIEKMPKIIIISNRKLEKGEELTYDYKFEFEDDQHKIACLCGAVNCRKWMN